MPMTPLELNTITKAAALAKYILQEIKPVIDALNVDYDAIGGVKETIGTGQAADDKLAAETSLSNLTKQELDDALYAITNGIKTTVDTAYSQLEKLASRGVLSPFGQTPF